MKRAICLMTLIPTAILAGCGSGSDSTQTQITPPTVRTPAKLSKAEYIKQADGYCAEFNAALGAPPSGGTTNQAARARDIGEYYGGLLLHLRDLGTPDDQTGLDEFLSAIDDIASAEDRVQEAARNGDSGALASAQSEVASAESRFASAGSAYGFKECGQGATTTSGTATAPSTAAPVTPAAPTTATPAPVTPVPSGGAGTGTGTGGGTGGATGGGTSGGSGGVGPG